MAIVGADIIGKSEDLRFRKHQFAAFRILVVLGVTRSGEAVGVATGIERAFERTQGSQNQPLLTTGSIAGIKVPVARKRTSIFRCRSANGRSGSPRRRSRNHP